MVQILVLLLVAVVIFYFTTWIPDLRFRRAIQAIVAILFIILALQAAGLMGRLL